MKLMESVIFGVIFFLTTGARCEVMELIAEAGSQVVLPCKCEALQCDPAAITWSKEHKGTVWRKQSSGLQYWGSNWFENGDSRVRCPHLEFAKGDYGLQINSVKEEDGGLYTCKVELRGHNSKKQVMLRVLQVSVSPSDPTLGDDVSIQCTMTPWRENAAVMWMLNGSPFMPDPQLVKNQSRGFLKAKVTSEMAGTWTCLVHEFTKVWRASAELSVGGIIQPPKDDTKLYAALGSPFMIPCKFSPKLLPLKAVLEKVDSRSQVFANRSASWSTSDKSIIIQEVVPENEGKYVCAGTTKGRRLTRTMQLVVAKIVMSKKKDSLILSCQLSDSSEVNKYEWVHVSYDINGTESVGPILYGDTVSVSGNSGKWTCRYFGESGLLGNVTTQVHLTAGLSGGKSSGVSSNSGVVIGLSFLLAILLLILAQMYKNHQRRKRILQYPALETIVHTISNEREEREKNRGKE